MDGGVFDMLRRNSITGARVIRHLMYEENSKPCMYLDGNNK